MTTISADQVRPGDVIVYRGQRHLIVDVERRDGWAWTVAADDNGWAIALGHQLIDVQRDGGDADASGGSTAR